MTEHRCEPPSMETNGWIDYSGSLWTCDACGRLWELSEAGEWVVSHRRLMRFAKVSEEPV